VVPPGRESPRERSVSRTPGGCRGESPRVHEAARPADINLNIHTRGPLRLKGEDCENNNVLTVQDAQYRIALALEASASPSTRRAYRADWEDFTTWCAHHHRCALPARPETIAAYLMYLEGEGRAVSTLRRRLATLRKAHRTQAPGSTDPVGSHLVQAVLKGVAKRRCEGHGQGATPVLPEQVVSMVEAIEDDSPKALRDRALLLLAITSGARRSELVGIQVEDLDWSDRRGVVVRIARGKTDPFGEGREVSITWGRRLKTCPVRALHALLQVMGSESGPLFRRAKRNGMLSERALTAGGVARVMKAAAAAAGLDPDEVSPHGFRSGHVSARRAAGEDMAAVMDATGHRAESSVRRYDRELHRFRHDVTGGLGL